MTGAFCVEQSRVHNSFVISALFRRTLPVRNHYIVGSKKSGKREEKNMPVQNYNEDLTELMKKSPTMSWALEG